MPESSVDATVVVVEPTLRSIDVARRAVAVADEQSQGQVVVVANKVEDNSDLTRISEVFGRRVLLKVPSDASVDGADRLGVSPLDYDPSSSAVEELSRLVDALGL